MHDNHHLQSTVAELNTLEAVLSRRARAFVRLLGMTQALNNPAPIARYQTPHLI